MARTNQIQFRRGTATQWSTTNPVLASGEPGFDTTNNLFRLGDGTTAWNNLINVGSNLYSTTRGSEIVTANKSAFTVTGGYVSGNLDVYWNGLKFLRNDDFTETSSTIFTLTNPAVSGDIVEWVGLVGPATYQISDAGLTSIAGLTTASGSYIYATASDVYTTGTITTFGRSLVDDADATTARTTLGLGTLATQSGTFSGTSSGTNTGDQTAASLGLTIGTNVQAYDAGLTSIAGLTTAADRYIYTTANDVYTTGAITTFGRSLVDDADASAGRTTLGLGTLATQSGTFSGTSSGTNTGDQTAASLGLTIGTNVQAYDAGLTSIAALTTASGNYLYATANDVYTTGTSTVYGRSVLAASGVESLVTTTLTAGTGILLSYNGGTDTVTISTSGLVIGTDVQAYDAGLTSIAGLTTAADRYIYTTANDVYTTGAITTFGRSLVDDADASTARTTLGLAIGTNVQEYSVKLADFIALVHSYGGLLISDGNNWVIHTPSSARVQLSLTVGIDVQAYDAGLTSIAGLTTAADRYIYTSANDVYTTGTITTFGRSLVDDADATTARTTLGLGTISTQASGNYALKSSQYIMGILFS